MDDELRSADRALESVNQAVGSARERFCKVAFDIADAHRDLDRLSAITDELAELESRVARWLDEVRADPEQNAGTNDLANRVAIFANKLRARLLDLGFSTVTKGNSKSVHFDDRYVPYLDSRRLRSLGSASDHARLVAAYVLALADASRQSAGPHPGFIVLDEPLQQNPDKKHRNLMLEFLERTASSTFGQLIVTTSLETDEVVRLKTAGVNVKVLPGKKFLKFIPDEPKAPEAGKS